MLTSMQAWPREADLSAPGHGGNPRARRTASWSIQEADHAHPEPAGRHRACPVPMPASRPSARRSGRSSTPRRAEFIAGCPGTRTVQAQMAEEIFELIIQFGGYGFNKSHSAAYAHVSYQTAYLKAHYPPEFMAALLVQRNRRRQQAGHHGRSHRRCPQAGHRRAAARRQSRVGGIRRRRMARSSSA